MVNAADIKNAGSTQDNKVDGFEYTVEVAIEGAFGAQCEMYSMKNGHKISNL